MSSPSAPPPEAAIPPEESAPHDPWAPRPFTAAPPAPRNRRNPVTIAAVVLGGVLLLIVGVAAVGLLGVRFYLTHGTAGPRTVFAFPPTLVNGRYAYSAEGTREVATRGDWFSAFLGLKDVDAQYLDESRQDALVIHGVYGSIGNRQALLRIYLRSLASRPGRTIAIPPATFYPTNSAETLTCEVFEDTGQDGNLTIPVCAWADGSTIGIVMQFNGVILDTPPDGVDLQLTADLVSQVRAEVRKPAGGGSRTGGMTVREPAQEGPRTG